MHAPLKVIAVGALAASILAPSGPAMAGVIFTDDFSTNQGWTLGPKWQIGPTKVSSGQNGGTNPDPALDRTPATHDNGVLGTVLGGNVGAPDGLHGFYYATSKLYNLTGVTGTTLSFWRWLNSDYDPYMTSQVEVFNGMAWQVIYTNCCVGSQGLVKDSAWTLQSFNVAQFADNNSQFRVRFSYDVTQSGVFTVSGWNVDDLQISGISGTVPEPASLALMGLAGLGLIGARRRKLRA